jgi:hypothetical protein
LERPSGAWPLAQLEARIAELITQEQQMVSGLREMLHEAMVAKATLAVQIGQILTRIKEEELWKDAGFSSFTAYLEARDEEGLFTRSSAQRWMRAAEMAVSVPQLADQPSKAAEIAVLDPALRDVLGPLLAGNDITKDDARTLVTRVKHMPAEEQQSFMRRVLKDKEVVRNIIEDRRSGHAIELAASRFRREKIVQPELQRRWNEERESEEARLAGKFCLTIHSFASEIMHLLKEASAHGGLSRHACELIEPHVHHVEEALFDLRQTLEDSASA